MNDSTSPLVGGALLTAPSSPPPFPSYFFGGARNQRGNLEESADDGIASASELQAGAASLPPNPHPFFGHPSPGDNPGTPRGTPAPSPVRPSWVARARCPRVPEPRRD